MEPLTFTEVRDALQQQFPDVNDRALGFCTRMLVPLVISPSETRWGWTANARFTPAEQWIGKQAAAEGSTGRASRPLSGGVRAGHPGGLSDLVRVA